MISKKIVVKYNFWFNNYVEQFIQQYPGLSENIEIKADHCRKVGEEIVGIAQSLKLNERDTLLAKTIGLFHDVGRFKQYVKYQTFSDSKSQNHGELALEVLKENTVLNDLSGENQDIIFKSILNHSRAEIELDKNDKVIFFSKLIRDADKLDIWRLITEYYMVKEQKPARLSADKAGPAGGENKTLQLELPDSDEISGQVVNAIVNKKVVLKENLKTLNDFKLLQIAWVFDLNFNYSIKKLYNKKYLDKIFETLPISTEVDQIREIVNKYFITTMSTKRE